MFISFTDLITTELVLWRKWRWSFQPWPDWPRQRGQITLPDSTVTSNANFSFDFRGKISYWKTFLSPSDSRKVLTMINWKTFSVFSMSFKAKISLASEANIITKLVYLAPSRKWEKNKLLIILVEAFSLFRGSTTEELNLALLLRFRNVFTFPISPASPQRPHSMIVFLSLPTHPTGMFFRFSVKANLTYKLGLTLGGFHPPPTAFS